MRKIIALFFLGFILMISCKSKVINRSIPIDKNVEINYIPYYLKVYEADSLYLVKEYEKSYLILDSLFKKYKPLNQEKFKEFETYISCAYVLNKKINLKDSILKSVENYGSNTRYFKYDSLMNLAYLKSKISDDESLKSTTKYLSKLNFPLRDTIKKICAVDQEIRNKNINYNDEIKKVDSLIQIKLIDIFTRNGYPGEKVIGEFYIDSTNVDLGAVFLHTNNEFRMNFLLPKILDAVKKGRAYPQMYTESMDRYLYENNNQKELYGSYSRKKKNLKYPQKIDSIRRSIGLPSMKYNNWRIKAKFGIDPNDLIK